MSLTRIDNPTPSAPAALADYVQILAVQNGAILQALRGNSHACIDFTNNLAKAGTVFYVAGVLYKAVTDQAISGTPSKYVKITPSGATASIAYVSSLSGVSWNDAQSGYYDGSGNLYVFDEARAVYDGVVSAGKTIEGQIAYIAGALSVKAGLIISGALSGVTDLTASGTIAALKAAFSQTTGTAPFTVASTTKVANLNADLLDDLSSSAFARLPISGSGVGQWTQLDSGAGNALNLPSGGTWAYVYLNPSSLFLLAGISGGGTQIAPASGAIRWTGMAWRIT